MAELAVKRKYHGSSYKRGCTGKIRYTTSAGAKQTCYSHYATEQDRATQVYGCRHCQGYHVTSSVLRNKIGCPALATSLSGKPPHLFYLCLAHTPEGRIMTASCVHCAVRLSEFTLVSRTELDRLTRVNVTKYKKMFVKQILSKASGAVVCLSNEQRELLDHILKGVS